MPVSSGRSSDELLEKAKSVASGNKAVQDLIKRYYNMESQLSRLQFMINQNRAELQKMVRNVQADGGLPKKKRDAKRLPRADTAKVKDIRMVDRGRMNSASVEIHSSISLPEGVNLQANLPYVCTEGKLVRSSSPSSSLSSTEDLQERDSIVQKLRAEVARLTRENFRLNSALSGSEQRESGVMAQAASAEGVTRVCNNCKNLREQLESKETNLLRSENKMQQMKETIANLEKQLDEMRRDGKLEESQESVDAFVTASTPRLLEETPCGKQGDISTPFPMKKHRAKGILEN
uniref:Uncharacterized protein n=1 Tax=Trichuris muris TaxID=70415 RepID=A0A5S6QGU4_TRIMR